MADYLAGTRIYALDRPPSAYAFESTSQTQVDSGGGTTYVEPTNTCRVTFTAPTSGRVKVLLGGGMRDNSNNNRGFLGVQIRETDISGAVVVAPSAMAHGIISMGEASDYYFHSRVTLLEGLQPGQVYFARVMIRAEGTGSNASVDLRNKNLAIIPVP